jgi:hypothetical protein
LPCIPVSFICCKNCFLCAFRTSTMLTTSCICFSFIVVA